MPDSIMVIPSIASDSGVLDLIKRLGQRGGVVHVSGLWGSSAPMLVALAARDTRRTILYVTAHADDADEIQDDIELFAEAPCELMPAFEALPGEGTAAGEIEAERLRVCTHLRERTESAPPAHPHLIVAPILALMQPVPTPKKLLECTMHLEVGRGSTSGGPDGLVQWAVDHGFERLDMVESPGDFARRGDIVDLFAPGETDPYRIEFLDDRIESIRRFDLSSQRSIQKLTSITITASPRHVETGEGDVTDLLAYLPDDALIVLDAPSEIIEMGRTLRRRLDDSDQLFGPDAVLARASSLDQMHLSRFGQGATDDEDTFAFDVASISRFEGKVGDAIEALCGAAKDHDIHVVCDSEGEHQRLIEMITEIDPSVVDGVSITTGVMHRGFEWRNGSVIVVAHHELFHRNRPIRRIRRSYAGRPVESWTDLKSGEFVVHLTHGIATYRGLTRLSKAGDGQNEEYLSLEFADQAVIHVPTSQIDLVQKYIGAGGIRPRRSKLGGKRWKRTKEQVAEAITDLASQLLQAQAQRQQAVGTAYPPDTEWQREFESAFGYEETEDQLTVAAEIRSDLQSVRPMDRLVCGDVGYGKTELAIRAAFKVVEFGRQVALLVPTTVLAEQHFETFSDRLAGYPFLIGCLSRFRSGKEQKEIVDRIRKGQLDIVIGTHRLLSQDVRFRNLGLVIVDEEQRFGVESKERLRTLRASVDVLTLTATPIPRTLHMAMIGIRDISSLQTPPVDRRSIATQVRPFDKTLIRSAIIREMNRGGQVYVVHNFVQSIDSMAEMIRQFVPEARVLVGHGQMKSHELESVMHRFVRHEADVLVATTIIESGIDIPNVNTILINRADRFGLADLHQLRGRVGRSSHRAYCYLLLSRERSVTGTAAKRLKAIEEFSELGAGFRIAMRDLEIRGAGNLLGKEQSGHIAAVGYELYCRLLDQTVRRMKDEPDSTLTPVHLDLDVSAYIPRHYMPSDRARLEMYRRMVGCGTIEDLSLLERDLIDAFGELPPSVQRLLALAEIRVLARKFGVRSVSIKRPDLVFNVEQLAAADAMFAHAPGSVRIADATTVHVRLDPSYLEAPTLLAVLRRMMHDPAKTKERAK